MLQISNRYQLKMSEGLAKDNGQQEPKNGEGTTVTQHPDLVISIAEQTCPETYHLRFVRPTRLPYHNIWTKVKL